MYNKKTLTFTFHHYWGAFCQGTFVLDPQTHDQLIEYDTNVKQIKNIYLMVGLGINSSQKLY
jgi:hypothetical protein